MDHVVTSPTPPFRSASGKLEVHQIPAWRDNLVWLLVDVETRRAAAVDGPDAGGVLDYCADRGIELCAVFNTHTHPDHVGINRDLEKRGLLAMLTVVGSKRAASDVPGITRAVEEGDSIELGGSTGKVLLTEGHIDGHISFVFDNLLFCGDTLFGAGCGYLFDGPPEKMHRSLTKLAELPGDTLVCCAHEYTEDNLKFAWSVEPGNAELEQRIRDTRALRERGECSVPSTIETELATNPFMRTASTELRERVASAMPDRDLATSEAIFAATRALKDRKDYRQLDDSALPG